MGAAPGNRDLKLAGLIPWIMRNEPLPAGLKTRELVPIYEAATKNLWRSDALIQTIGAVLYSSVAALGNAPAQPTSNAALLDVGLAEWERTSAALPLIALGAEGLLSSCLVQSWTTFETLVTDTWVAALNMHPRGLSNLTGGKVKTGKDDDRKSVSLALLQRYNYDLSNSMGSLLRSKYGFDSLNGVRTAYRDAFGDVKSIHDPLADPALDALNAIRQVLVHRSGIADEEYVSKVANLPLAPQVRIGDPLLLDGEVTAALLFAGRSIALAFLTAVDEWLAANP
jgi:hypothetical protein